MGMSWHRFGVERRQREMARIADADIALGADIIPHRAEIDFEPYCGDDCWCCGNENVYDREAIRRRLAVNGPTYTLAERVLAQVGLDLRVVGWSAYRGRPGPTRAPTP